jgi:hypothetical protein
MGKHIRGLSFFQNSNRCFTQFEITKNELSRFLTIMGTRRYLIWNLVIIFRI